MSAAGSPVARNGGDRLAPRTRLPRARREDPSLMADGGFQAGERVLKVLCYSWGSIPGVSVSCMRVSKHAHQKKKFETSLGYFCIRPCFCRS